MSKSDENLYYLINASGYIRNGGMQVWRTAFLQISFRDGIAFEWAGVHLWSLD